MLPNNSIAPYYQHIINQKMEENLEEDKKLKDKLERKKHKMGKLVRGYEYGKPHQSKKYPRNYACPCDSGKKYKHCCLGG